MDRFAKVMMSLGGLDRRYIYLFLLLAVTLPLIFPVSFTAAPTVETRRFAKALDEAIAKSEPILISVDYRPQTLAEMEPILLAVMHHVFFARKPVVFLNFTEETSSLLRGYLSDMENRYSLKYGRDYVYLGYVSSYAQAIHAMGRSIGGYLHADDRGIPLDDLPLMAEVKKLRDFSTVISVASIAMAEHWISFGVAPYKIDFLAATTATKAVDYFPYLQTGQMKGLMAGGRAAAEYEGILLKRGVLSTSGDATRSLGSGSLAIFTIVAFVVLGNAGYFLGRRRALQKGDV